MHVLHFLRVGYFACVDGTEFGSGNCPNGHIFSLQFSLGHGCDICKGRIVVGGEMRSCRECDYDKHLACGDANALCICAHCGMHKDKHAQTGGNVMLHCRNFHSIYTNSLTIIVTLLTVDREQLKAQLPNCEISF